MEHPITPPPELLEQWLDLPLSVEEQLEVAARWGADQRLEEIVHWLVTGPYGASIVTSAPNLVADLRAVCSPKPPSLKQQALEALDSASYQPGSDFKQIDPARSATIRRALESLPDPQD